MKLAFKGGKINSSLFSKPYFLFQLDDAAFLRFQQILFDNVASISFGGPKNMPCHLTKLTFQNYIFCAHGLPPNLI